MITAHISSVHVLQHELADGELHIVQQVLGDEQHVTLDGLGNEQHTTDGVELGDGQDVLHVIVDEAHDTLHVTVGQDVLHTIDDGHEVLHTIDELDDGHEVLHITTDGLGDGHEVLHTTIDSVIQDTLLSSYSSLTALLVPASPRYTLSSFTRAAVEYPVPKLIIPEPSFTLAAPLVKSSV